MPKPSLASQLMKIANQLAVYVAVRENGTEESLRVKYLKPVADLWALADRVKELEDDRR